MKVINIQEFSPEDRMTRIGGEKLRLQILGSTLPVKLDFQGKALASVSFLDEGIAKLVEEGWTKQKIETDVLLLQIHPRDLALLQLLIEAHLR